MRRALAVAAGLVALAGGAAIANETLLAGCDPQVVASIGPATSLDAAYRAAPSCSVVELQAGAYPVQELRFDSSKTDAVVFRPAPGARVSLAGFSTGRVGSTTRVEGADHFELRDMAIAGQLALTLAEDVTLRSIDAGSLNISGSQRVRVLGGDYGPVNDGISHIKGCGGTWGQCPPIDDVLIDGALFHDATITDPAKHSECLMIWPSGASNITVRNSTFRNCTDFGVLVKAPNTSGVVFENVTMDKPMLGNVSTVACNPDCPRGGNSIRFSSYQYPGSRVADSCLEGGLGIDVAGFVEVSNTQVNAASCESPPEPTTPTETEPTVSTYADDFERTSVGPNWQSLTPATPGIIAGDLGISSGVFILMRWAGGPSPADQFSEAELSDGINASELARGVWVRRNASSGARYQFHYDGNGTDADPRPQWQIKLDGVPTAQTRLIAVSLSPGMPQPGDVLRIEAEGSQLRGYLNGQLILSGTDTALTGGDVGVAAVSLDPVTGAGKPVTKPEPAFRRWAGGELVAAPPPPPPDSLPLTILAQDETTVTVGWTPTGDAGYRFLVDGKAASNTNDPTRSSVRFQRKPGAKLEVIARSVVASGSAVSP